MTSVTPKSAMTSVTDNLLVTLSLAAKGARRATGAVKESSGQSLTEPIIMLVNNDLIHPYGQLLSSHIDGRDYILVDRFRRYPKPFAEDVEQRITADETDQVIAAALRLRQRMFWRCGRFRKPNLRLAQSLLRCAPLQLGVAIPRVMFCFKDQRFSIQVLYATARPSEETKALPLGPGKGESNSPSRADVDDCHRKPTHYLTADVLVCPNATS